MVTGMEDDGKMIKPDALAPLYTPEISDFRRKEINTKTLIMLTGFDFKEAARSNRIILILTETCIKSEIVKYTGYT